MSIILTRTAKRATGGLGMAALVVALMVMLPARPVAADVDVSQLKAIVTAAEPMPLEQQAARELRTYFEKLYGLSLPVEARKDIGPDTTNVILVGHKAARAAQAVTEAELKKLRWDGYVIGAGGGRMFVAGPRSRATLYGVSGLLEHLGVRFYGAVEAVPTPTSKMVPDFRQSDKPAFEFRRVHGGWKLKAGADDLAYCNKSMEKDLFKPGQISFDHTAGFLVPPPLYYKDHPEYYALVNGKRIMRTAKGDRRDSYKQTVLCLSNPNVTRIAAERMIAWMDKEPERRFFPCTYGDTATYCQCAECKKLDEVPGQYTDRKLHWVNGVARAVREKHPDKVLITWAYLNSHTAPKRVKPEPNVIVCFAPWWGLDVNCRMHPYALCWRAHVGARCLEDWFKWCPGNLGWYDYAGSWPEHRAFEWRLKFSAKRGARAYFKLSRTKRLTPMAQYVKAKLAWNPKLDPIALEKDFCRAYYGPKAGPLMWEYIDAWYHEFIDTGTHRPRGEAAYPAKALRLLEQIEQAAGPETIYGKRARHDLEGFHRDDHSWKEYAEIQGPGRYHALFGGSLEQFKDWMRSVKDTGLRGPGFEPIEPKLGEQGYDRQHLWLAQTRIGRREFKEDAKLTRLDAIVAPGQAQAARKLQGLLKKIYGIELPIEQRDLNAKTRGVIAVGRRAALATGLIGEADLKAAGPAGMVVRGLDGRVAIAATRDENIDTALEGLLYVLRSRHGGVEALGDTLPKAEVPILRAFTFLDWPPLGAVVAPRPDRPDAAPER